MSNSIFPDATKKQVDKIMAKAQAAFEELKWMPGRQKAQFLNVVAAEIEALGDELIQTAHRETHLPEARLVAERSRTIGQLKMFANLLEEGSWVEATIDTALPNRMPAPKPDLRKMLIPLGPVVVFGASNFPFAYSMVGVDTAAAWAAGCPVVVKAHPAHPATCELFAKAVKKAVKKTKMPEGIFGHVHGVKPNVGKALVLHPLTQAVGFTGSFAGGKALFDLANKRPRPIPIFAEMGSVNPVFLLPNALRQNPEGLAKTMANSITLGVGQFCTNPGLLFGVYGQDLDVFSKALSEEIRKTQPVKMLHEGIARSFRAKRQHLLAQKGAKLEAETTAPFGETEGIPSVASVTAADFINNPALQEEVFGPFSLLVKCRDMAEMEETARHIEGQLTTSLMATPADLKNHPSLFQFLTNICGRLIVNGVPTGVEVCPAMHHGGPFPATTDSRFTSVGAHAIRRFVRPVAFQNLPDEFLPAALQNANPLGIWRTVNGEWTKSGI